MPRLLHRALPASNFCHPAFYERSVLLPRPLYWATRVLLCLAALILMAVPLHSQSDSGFTLPPPADAAEALRLAFYAYDRSLPLNAKRKPLDANGRRSRHLVTYDSAHDQRVSAVLTLPKRFRAPYPAVILMHGAGGHKDVEYVRFASEALVGQGIATLSLDAQYRGDRVRPGRNGDLRPDLYLMRDAWIQTVIDLRRAIDYLEARPDMDKSKIGYLGFSMGGMLGTVLGGVEARIAAFYLAVPGGGLSDLVRHIDRYPLLKSRWPVEVTPDVLKRVDDITNVIDPVHFAGRILPRPLRIVVAKQDEVIPAVSSQALIEAAHADEAQHVKRLDAGHALHPNISFDIRDYFTQLFGKPAAE